MSNVAHITPHLRNVEAPAAIRDLPAWVIWRFEAVPGGGKPRKVPYYANGGKRHGEQGGPKDVANLVTFDAAKAAAARRGYDGVGFAALQSFGICALDFDNCITDGKIHPQVEALLGDTYAEFSPSGQGIRAFFKGDLGNGKSIRNTDFGMECFSTRGFVTFTGNTLDITELLGNDDVVAPLPEVVRALHAERFTRSTEPLETGTSGEPAGLTTAQIQECLAALPTDLHYDDYLMVGMAIHCETSGAGFEIWEEWCMGSGKYSSREYNEDRWRSFGKGGGTQVTGRSLVHLANQYGARISLNGPAGADEFEDLVDAPPAPDKPLRFGVIPAHEFSQGATPTWVIKDVLPQAELVVLYGASGSGKSFIALDMAAAIARGIPWRGKKTRKGRVAYIAAEGGGGFRKRLTAYGQHHGFNLADMDFGVIHAAPNMMEKADAVDIVKSVRAWGGADIIIVDTFAQVMPGANENAGEDVGKALTHCKRIHEATGAMVILIHHAGKDTSKGARGWSGLRAAADAELEVVREVAGRSLRLTKSKDGEDGQMWGFDLEVVKVGVDEDLEPITSCVVIEAALPAVGGIAMKKLGPVEQVVNAVIQEYAIAQNSGIEVGPVLAEAVKRLDAPTDNKRDTRKQRARRALEALTTGDDAPYWIADDGCITIC
jgi:ABC-type dipeptide/oligopeptide/nickel transport system ATPase component